MLLYCSYIVLSIENVTVVKLCPYPHVPVAIFIVVHVLCVHYNIMYLTVLIQSIQVN